MGPHMRAETIEEILPMEAFHVMGFSDIVKTLPRLLRNFFYLKRYILEKNPKACLFIDYQEFHMRLERSLKKSGYSGKIFHYVAPSVWAWRKKRAETLAKSADHLFTIFPFEKDYFSHTKLPTQYVGHPLVETIPRPQTSSKEKLLAIFPGSRKEEIQRNLPMQLQAATRLHKNYGWKAAICFASKELRSFFPSLPSFIEINYSDKKYELMNRAALAMATSGTITLELALHLLPTIVTYAIKPLDLFLARKVFKINLPYYCIVNILAQESVYPELFGPHLSVENIYYYLTKMIQNPLYLQRCQKKCKEVARLLGKQKASSVVAQKICNFIKFKPDRATISRVE